MGTVQKKVWQTIFDGGSSQWLEMRRFGTEGRIYHAVRIDDMDDACGRDNEGHAKYAGDLLEIDLNSADLDDAARSSGWIVQRDAKGTARSLVDEYRGDILADGETLDIVLAEVCVSHGAYAPLESDASNNLSKLLRDLKRASRAMDNDADAREAALSRPVNALGSTAREYARGDFDSALARGLAKGDTGARVMAQMHAPIPSGGIACMVKIHDDTLASLSNGDPLAYHMGFMAGYQGTTDTIEDGETFADAYVKGREHGARVRIGLDPVPSWIT